MKTLARKNLPVSSPILPTLAWWLLLDRLEVSGVVWGVAYSVAALVWAVNLYTLFKTEQVDIFK